MWRLRRGNRPKVYLIEPSPDWCAAVLKANGVEFIAKRISDKEVSVNTYLGESTEAELIRVIA
ncbi:hypothetical protein [Caldivirga maquilingensis]|uniref:Uncharacterized protein n=1 Tax=Caldivirga maquilingensis (strain ATCC 700844 / DSM 13496 / JCM 10307 / IC-167) TaxID=397948 RepID=A8M9E2_CALMQ|nr:hypothetical protein [Caldivirga maquilingensis]ABW02361.1 hypothetical protein Cmaq_1538 [Caldivirga maquilingensis IC-167]